MQYLSGCFREAAANNVTQATIKNSTKDVGPNTNIKRGGEFQGANTEALGQGSRKQDNGGTLTIGNASDTRMKELRDQGEAFSVNEKRMS